MTDFQRHRTKHQNELVNILTSPRKPWYACTSGNNQGWDVLLWVQNGKVLPFEVKSSSDEVLYMRSNKRVKEQYLNYIDIYERFGIETIYAFRLVKKGKIKNERDRWRCFLLSEIPKKVPKLEWEKGRRIDNAVARWQMNRKARN